MNTILKSVLVLLAIAAIGFGFKIYALKAPNETGTPAAANTQNNSSQKGTTKTDAERKAILTTPGADATDADREAFFKLIVASAEQTNTLDINACSPNPVAISIRKGDDLVLVNDDTGPHTVVFDEKTFYTVEAGGKKTVKADFGKGAGIYGYGCDQSTSAVGIVLLTQEQ